MKKSFFFVLAVLSVAACQKEASVEAEVNGGNTINFSAYISRGITKAPVTDVTTANLDTFRVACYQAGTATKYFVKEQKATKSDDLFKTADTYYWPSTGTPSFDFFAYRGTVTSEISNTAGTATITYAVPAAANEDLIAAAVKAQGKASSVSLTFDHILTKIDSLVIAPLKTGAGTTAQYKYKFTAVKVSTDKNAGTYTFGGNWGDLGGSKTDYAFTTQTGDFTGNASKVLKSGTPAANDQMIVMPQENVTFSVTYSVDYSADGTTWSEIMTSTTKSAKITLAKGYAYGITLRLPIDASASSEIVFDVTVNDWSHESKDVDLN